MAVLNSDSVLWYNVGIFGEAGYAVPNWSNDVGTLNPQIYDIVYMVGKNLFNIMHHEDVDLRIPPSINTLKRIHKLYVRFAQILTGRAIAPSKDNMEIKHVRPAGETFLVFPVPYFKVRNLYLKRWAQLIMILMSEAMQHTENRKEMEISTLFAGQIGQYMTRVYKNMAVEMFGKTQSETDDPTFLLKDDDFNSYDPSKFFTSTELVDTVPRLDRVFTEDRLEVLAEGIPISSLPELKPWPLNLTDYYESIRTDQTIKGTDDAAASKAAAGVIPPPPGP